MSDLLPLIVAADARLEGGCAFFGICECCQLVDGGSWTLIPYQFRECCNTFRMLRSEHCRRIVRIAFLLWWRWRRHSACQFCLLSCWAAGGQARSAALCMVNR